MSTLTLISCSKVKLPVSEAPAGELYSSSLFRKARAYAEHLGDEWGVLSAKYGLLNPDDVVPNYDLTLNDLSKEDRNAWAYGVASDIIDHHSEIKMLVLLAGRNYVEPLVDILSSAAPHILIHQPLKGLQIGERLRYLSEVVA